MYDIYIKAAGFMMSEDPGIGLAVLFSYDYFALFHLVLCDYFTTGQIAATLSLDETTTKSVVNLRKKMER